MNVTRWLAVLTVCALQAAAGARADDIKIDAPLGGWRNSSNERMRFLQTVNYPAASVNVQNNQSRAALIKGHIAGAKKGGREPAKLIVNGVPMPLRLDNGNFARPYSFGPGSNSVEVRGADGITASRVQFYETSVASNPRLRVVLSWDTDGTDLDLHVITPDGGHCFYGNRVLNNGGALDVDVTTGYGPEIFATPAPFAGTYLVYVNYYGSGRLDEITVANITTITNENTADEKMQSVTVPLRKPGELTLVHSFVYP